MSDYRTYAKCECGFFTYAPFGEILHTHLEVCPDCGLPAKKMRVVIGMVVPVGRWYWPPSWGQILIEREEGNE
jgi:hypothetical protein